MREAAEIPGGAAVKGARLPTFGDSAGSATPFKL
jgi:hypothetical protein